MDKTKTYLVLNYSPSPIGIRTRNDSFVIEGGNSEEPTSMPFTLDEIVQINSGSRVFTSGLLRFEKEYEKDIYEELRIHDWQNIMTDEEIEEIIKNPTVEGLQKILDIKIEIYFERVYGVFMGLLNAGYPISQKVQNIMKARRYEFSRNIKTTKISITPKDTQNDDIEKNVDEIRAQNEELKKQLAEIQAMMAQMNKSANEKATTSTVDYKEKVVKKVGRPSKNTTK